MIHTQDRHKTRIDDSRERERTKGGEMERRGSELGLHNASVLARVRGVSCFTISIDNNPGKILF